MLDYKNTEFKSLDELRETTPSIFTQLGSKDTSDKYTHIPTDKVIVDMELLGWGVVDSKEVKARTEGTVGFQKHLVVFRNPDVVINGENGDTVYPQVLLTNSHDGKNSFKFTAGLFRMICENGLVIATETFEDIKVRHMGYDFETLQGIIKEMVAKLPLTVECMNKMKSVELKEEQMFELAKSFLDIRIEGTDNTFDNQAIEDVLLSQRVEDNGDCLWEVFNRIQENIIEGNFKYNTSGGKTRQARVIKNFKQDQDLNKKLFSKALEFAN
jgi:translation initiation factor IF-1